MGDDDDDDDWWRGVVDRDLRVADDDDDEDGSTCSRNEDGIMWAILVL